MGYLIRYIATKTEIADVFAVMEKWFVPPIPDDAWVPENLLSHYPDYKDMMIISECDGQLVGGALGFSEILAIIGVRPDQRRKGLARRLLQTFEIGAMHHGSTMISLGAREKAKGFYRRVGYSGKSSMHKGLPFPGKSLDWRLSKIDAVLGDLAKGQYLELDETGKLAPLFVKF